jgi:hypothetical protein
MDIKALVLFRDHYALYLISRENEGIFTARLKRYDGEPGVVPPECITLTKGFRSWNGSTDEQELVDGLGEVIEVNLQSGIFFSEKEED